MTLTLTSPAFSDGGAIPRKYSRDGNNVLPPLKWTGVPDGTKSLVLIVEDPDAPNGTFRHLAIYDIPATRIGFEENADMNADSGMRLGRNDFGSAAYDGPEPPHGHGAHHYHFRLAALDVPKLDIQNNADVKAVWDRAQKHRIEEAELVGTYER